MMYYETIPSLVSSTVQALYGGLSIHAFDFSSVERVFNIVKTDDQVASIKIVLTQISLILCGVFALLIVFVMMQKRMYSAQQVVETAASVPQEDVPAPAGALRDRWNQLLTNMESTHESQWKAAVIEADTLVDDALAKAGYPGATFGDRLSNIEPGNLLSLDGVWWAHRIRNRLAHEADFFLRYTEARQAVGYYEAALTELQLL